MSLRLIGGRLHAAIILKTCLPKNLPLVQVEPDIEKMRSCDPHTMFATVSVRYHVSRDRGWRGHVISNHMIATVDTCIGHERLAMETTIRV